MVMTAPTNPKTRQIVAKKLRKIREEKGLSQEELAKAAGISVGFYARIERGKHSPTNDTLESICKVLKIKSSEILPF